MIFHENHLLADDSHDISMAYLLILKKRQNLKLSSAANYRWRFMGYGSQCRSGQGHSDSNIVLCRHPKMPG